MDSKNCPVTLTTHVIGGKWKPSILFYLERRVCRFSELQRFLAGPTKKMLTQQLRELERDDIVRRKVYAEVPPRVEYSLTKHGQSLRPILRLMSAWGKKHRARYCTIGN
jgi:DNA-binding HxlR family transcriptional regulator